MDPNDQRNADGSPRPPAGSTSRPTWGDLAAPADVDSRAWELDQLLARETAQGAEVTRRELYTARFRHADGPEILVEVDERG